jgi:hypothetical protein
MLRDPHDYTIEVCIRCGCQLSRGTPAGRCINRDHWGDGGMVVRVEPREADVQDLVTRRYYRVLTALASRETRLASETDQPKET